MLHNTIKSKPYKIKEHCFVFHTFVHLAQFINLCLFLTQGGHRAGHQQFLLSFALHLFFINNPILTIATKIVSAFLKNRSKQLFSNCLADGLLTSIVQIFKYSKCRHSLLQGHLEHVMHTFELTSPKVSIPLRFPVQKKGFSLYSQQIV